MVDLYISRLYRRSKRQMVTISERNDDLSTTSDSLRFEEVGDESPIDLSRLE